MEERQSLGELNGRAEPLYQQAVLLIAPLGIPVTAVVTLGDKIPEELARDCLHITQCLHGQDFLCVKEVFFIHG